MDDSQCVAFLQWALPRLGMRWPGFRKVRGQVCKRLRRRLAELGLDDADAYQAYLEQHAEEWGALEQLTHITISRFHRDRGVFAFLQAEVIPQLAADAVRCGASAVSAWSAGCASGEEAYTLGIVWQLALAARFPTLAVRILATDVDDAMLARAGRACFTAGSLRELPEHWRAAAFVERDGEHCVNDAVKRAVTVARHDIRRDRLPAGPFDLVACRNLAFTYFDAAGQRAVARRLAGALRPGGALVLGAHEVLPGGTEEFEPWSETVRVYRRTVAGGSGR